VPAQELQMIPITWPFEVWGLDMVGPFKRSKDKKTHFLVAVDKFTKWVEAEPISNCDATTAAKFLKKLIFHFGYPHSIITDNGINLSKGAMKEFCQREHIRLDVSSVAHPQSNGQADHANQEIL
jgi:transposase-like protein